MTGLLFITPAWQRYELTRLCLWQRRTVCDHLASKGIHATCLVIADDENLDTAREYGFETLESPNDFLSRRFNDGYEYAGRNGFDYVCPIGSDSWIDPELLEELPSRRMQVSRNYAVVREDGERIAELALRTPFGFGCFTLPTEMLKKFDYRPCAENLAKGCDGSLFKALYRSLSHRPRVTIRELGPLDIVAFRSELQITPYERLVQRHGAREMPDPFERLRMRYPSDLVSVTERFHHERMGALSAA
jgi:glycosyltransferase involved in cell wall biosynthesis